MANKIVLQWIDHPIYHCAGYVRCIKSLCDSPQQHPIHCDKKQVIKCRFASGCVEQSGGISTDLPAKCPIRQWQCGQELRNKRQFASGSAIHRLST